MGVAVATEQPLSNTRKRPLTGNLALVGRCSGIFRDAGTPISEDKIGPSLKHRPETLFGEECSHAVGIPFPHMGDPL